MEYFEPFTKYVQRVPWWEMALARLFGKKKNFRGWQFIAYRGRMYVRELP